MSQAQLKQLQTHKEILDTLYDRLQRVRKKIASRESADIKVEIQNEDYETEIRGKIKSELLSHNAPAQREA